MTDEDCGSCPACGVRWHIVRPGKTQPSCDCYCTCSVHKTTYEFVTEPGHSYYGCTACGPHGTSLADTANLRGNVDAGDR